MVSETWILLTVIPSLVLAATAIFVYGRIEFREIHAERSLIKSGMLLLPLYALLEFGAAPESDLPVVVLFFVGSSMAYAFQKFSKEAHDEVHDEEFDSEGEEE